MSSKVMKPEINLVADPNIPEGTIMFLPAVIPQEDRRYLGPFKGPTGNYVILVPDLVKMAREGKIGILTGFETEGKHHASDGNPPTG